MELRGVLNWAVFGVELRGVWCGTEGCAELMGFWCWTEVFRVLKRCSPCVEPMCWTERVCVEQRGTHATPEVSVELRGVLNCCVFGVDLRDFGSWKGVAFLCGTDVLNWGECGTERDPYLNLYLISAEERFGCLKSTLYFFDVISTKAKVGHRFQAWNILVEVWSSHLYAVIGTFFQHQVHRCEVLVMVCRNSNYYDF